jgi:hypothetical protein
MNTLIIVDVDDTLFIDNIKHIINKTDNNEFDYSHYHRADTFSQCEPIQEVIDEINEYYKDPGNKVVFVTARSGMDDMDLYIQTFINAGLDVTHDDIFFAGVDKPTSLTTYELKQPIFEQLLDSQIWNKAKMYEDNKKNLVGFMWLCVDRNLPYELIWIDKGKIRPLSLIDL